MIYKAPKSEWTESGRESESEAYLVFDYNGIHEVKSWSFEWGECFVDCSAVEHENNWGQLEERHQDQDDS